MIAAEYRHLWDGSTSDWALLRVDGGSDGLPSYLPVNIATRGALIIEDEAVAAEVIATMLERGCRVITAAEWSRP